MSKWIWPRTLRTIRVFEDTAVLVVVMGDSPLATVEQRDIESRDKAPYVPLSLQSAGTTAQSAAEDAALCRTLRNEVRAWTAAGQGTAEIDVRRQAPTRNLLGSIAIALRFSCLTRPLDVWTLTR